MKVAVAVLLGILGAAPIAIGGMRESASIPPPPAATRTCRGQTPDPADPRAEFEAEVARRHADMLARREAQEAALAARRAEFEAELSRSLSAPQREELEAHMEAQSAATRAELDHAARRHAADEVETRAAFERSVRRSKNVRSSSSSVRARSSSRPDVDPESRRR